jgi:uncharacterized damage-inducible protein DinB
MAEEYGNTAAFRGARFTYADLSGVTIRDCDLSGLKVTGSLLDDVSIAGDLGRIAVNDVDVTAFVQEELDRRYPARAQWRGMRTADDYRATWATIERVWSEVMHRAERLPEQARQERVDDEWSLVETLRHLVFATDAWAARTVLDQPMPYHPLGLTHSFYPRADALALGIDLDARPTFAEVVAFRADRMALVRRLIDGLTDAELERPVTRTPAPGYPQEPRTVGSCLSVVMEEEVEHHRYTMRDLAVVESRLDS